MSKKELAKSGVFDELIKKLKDANAKIAECEAIASEVLSNQEMEAAGKIAAYMERYNAAILSFVNLGKDCERLVKNQKASMWRNKEYFTKNILK